MLKQLKNLNLKCLTLISRSAYYSEWVGETCRGEIIVIKKLNNNLSGAISDCENRARMSLDLLWQHCPALINIDWLTKFFNWTIEDEVFEVM